MLLDFRYTNKEISLIYLDHIILHTNVRLDKYNNILYVKRMSIEGYRQSTISTVLRGNK